MALFRLYPRYTVATKALDLKNFHADPQFLGEPMYVPLNRSVVLNEIIKIVGDNIPEVEAIDLSENSLRSFDNLSLLTDKTPNVKLLYLAKNRVS